MSRCCGHEDRYHSPGDCRARSCASVVGGQSERASSYTSPADQGRSLLAAALLRAVTARALNRDPMSIQVDRECQDCGQPHGKPIIDGIHVSVSHAGLLIVVAAGPVPVGVDVERIADLTRSGYEGGVEQWCAAEARTKLGHSGTVTCQQVETPIAGYGACVAVARSRPARLVLHGVAASARALQEHCPC